MFRVHETVPGEEVEEMEVVEVVEVMIIITSNLEPNNPSDGAAAPPELDSDPQQTHTAPSERERGPGRMRSGGNGSSGLHTASAVRAG